MKNSDTILDTHGYPTRWRDYIGQEPAQRMLQVAVKSAKIRKQPLPHVLIAHPSPGVGKTALANLVARSLNKPCRVISGAVNANKARMLFADMNDFDVLLYDEIHEIMDAGRKNAEWTLTYLQDGTLPGPFGAELQPRVTIIGATTEAGRMPDNIVRRFIQPPMQDYTEDEAAKIAIVMSRDVLGEFDLPPLAKRNAMAIAAAAVNNPGAIRNLLIVLRDMSITGEIPLKGKGYDVGELLVRQGVTPDGLDPTAQRYLTTLAHEFDGAAGAKAMEDRLQQAGGLQRVERILMDKGLLVKTRSGRTLTQAGIGRVRELVA